MNRETMFVIDHFKANKKLVESSNEVPDKGRRAIFLKKTLDLNEMFVTLIQSTLYYTAISNIDWEAVVNELEATNENNR